MYLQIKKIYSREREKAGKKFNENYLRMIGLYKDNGDWVKRIKQDEIILQILKEAKIGVELPKIFHLLTDEDVVKIAGDTTINLFDNNLKGTD